MTVLVAKQAIAKGTSGTRDRDDRALLGDDDPAEPAAQRLRSATPSSLRDKVATRDIYQGSQLTAADFAPASTDVAASLTKHQRIITVPFDAVHGTLANLQAGDHVDIYAIFNLITVNAERCAARTAAWRTPRCG